MPGRSHFRGLTHSKLSFTLQRFRLFGVALKPCCGYSCNVLRRIDVPVRATPTGEGRGFSREPGKSAVARNGVRGCGCNLEHVEHSGGEVIELHSFQYSEPPKIRKIFLVGLLFRFRPREC